jgi:glyoxylase I family protein
MAVVAPGQQGLDIFERAANDGEQFDPTTTGLDHIALTAPSHGELEQWANWLDAHNVSRSAVRDVDQSKRHRSTALA